MLPVSPLSFYSLTDPELAAADRKIVSLTGRLSGLLHPSAAKALRGAMAGIHSYYSNLIEGPSTHPIAAELAVAEPLDGLGPSEQNERYRQQALAGIVASLRMTARLSADPHLDIASPAFIQELHRAFTERLPMSMRIVTDSHGATHTVVPGAFRSQAVAVGRHVAPPSSQLPELMAAFHRLYEGSPQDTATAFQLHHRFMHVHPFLDGNGRAGRLLLDAMLIRSGAWGEGLWSMSRGLAKNRAEYLEQLSAADAPRKGDYDGRGALSQSQTLAWVKFMMRVATDQVEFMIERLQTDRILPRLERLCEDRESILGRDRRAALLVREALLAGPYERGRAADLIGRSSRTASKIIRECLDDGLLVSDTEKGALRVGFPMYALAYLVPHLFEVDDPQAAMKSFCEGARRTKLASDLADEAAPVIEGPQM